MPKLMTMASAGAIRGEYSPYGGVQWRLGKPWTCFVGQRARNRTGASSWPSKWPMTEAHLIVVAAFFL